MTPHDLDNDPQAIITDTPQPHFIQPSNSLGVGSTTQQDGQNVPVHPYPEFVSQLSQPPEPTSTPAPVVAPSMAQEPTEAKKKKRRRTLPSAPINKRKNDHIPLALPESPATSAWGTATVNPSTLMNPSGGTNQTTTTTTPTSTSQSYLNTQHVAAATHAILQEENRRSSTHAAQKSQTGRSPYQATAPAPRAKSRQSNRAQSRTPVPERAPSRASNTSALQYQQQTQPRAQQQAVTGATARMGVGVDSSARQNSGSSRTAQTTTRSPDVATYNAAPSMSGLGNFNYTEFPSQTQDESDQTSHRIAYEPYSNHPTAASANNQSYTYDNSNRSTTSNATGLSSSATQSRTTGYSASTSTSASHWGQQQMTNTNTAVSPTPSTTSYSQPSLAAPVSSYSQPSLTTSASSQNYFNLRDSSSTTTTTTTHGPSNPYTQKAPQQSRQQYPTYNPQPAKQAQMAKQSVQQQRRQNTHQQQHQQLQTQTQTQNHHQQRTQQNWYGFDSSATTSSAQNNYRSARDSHSGYVGAGSYQHHHNSLNLPNHGGSYGGADNDPLIDLLGASVHHRH